MPSLLLIKAWAYLRAFGFGGASAKEQGGGAARGSGASGLRKALPGAMNPRPNTSQPRNQHKNHCAQAPKNLRPQGCCFAAGAEYLAVLWFGLVVVLGAFRVRAAAFAGL